MISAFIFLGIGSGISTVVFICEHLIAKYFVWIIHVCKLCAPKKQENKYMKRKLNSLSPHILVKVATNGARGPPIKDVPPQELIEMEATDDPLESESSSILMAPVQCGGHPSIPMTLSDIWYSCTTAPCSLNKGLNCIVSGSRVWTQEPKPKCV